MNLHCILFEQCPDNIDLVLDIKNSSMRIPTVLMIFINSGSDSEAATNSHMLPTLCEGSVALLMVIIVIKP